ncbi:MAG: hypothetical protein IKV03_02355 [Alphaproteobacteria bacterium]|nr:hypothetical protein [Alphaproteobacteria bacterium]
MTIRYKEKYFIIECNENNDGKGYAFKTKQGKEFARGSTYCSGDNNPRYFAVENEEGLWTLYDRNGQPVKGAQNVKHIYWNKKCYVVGLGEKKTYIFPEYKIKQGLRGLAICGALVVAYLGVSQIHGCCEKQAEYEQKTQMTYLGISNGVALFDTDGNKQTAEVVSDTLLRHQVGYLYGCEGQTHSIAQWKEISQIHMFENIR